MFSEKKILITGGTGSFGNAVLDRLLASNISEIRIMSRDEKKQDEMRQKYNNDKLKFYIGDVRDLESVNYATKGVDFVFHAAALKQVPSCEFFPFQATKTNVIGTENVLDCAINNRVKKVICLSTDKAVYPINAMGITKALMEKIAVAKARNSSDTTICITRYGNVMASRGSVIPLFFDQIRANKPITITNPEMTRFMMTLDDAVDLVLYAFQHGNSGEIFIQKSPAVTIDILANAVKNVMNKPNHPVKLIGNRHGEKLYESLLSSEEMSIANDLGEYYCISPDKRELNYSKYIDVGIKDISKFTEYNSHNATRLDIVEMVRLLSKVQLLSDHTKDIM